MQMRLALRGARARLPPAPSRAHHTTGHHSSASLLPQTAGGRSRRNALEREGDASAVADALDGALLVARDAVVADVERRHRPDGVYGRCSMDGAGVSGICNGGTDSTQRRTAWPCGDATYSHSGRAAAMCLAPSDQSLLSLTSKLVIAPLALRPSASCSASLA